MSRDGRQGRRPGNSRPAPARKPEPARAPQSPQPDKRFWDMTGDEIDDFIGARGMEAWKAKILQDRAHARELEEWPNPWQPDHEDERRQKIIASLNPDLADRLRAQAGK